MLVEASLGEKKITFTDIDCNGEEYRKKITESFPKLLEGGGYELLRCCNNSRSLQILSPIALTSPKSTRDLVGRSKVYIRPVQKDLDTSTSSTEDFQFKCVSTINIVII